MTGRLPRWLGVVAGSVFLFLHLPILILVVFSFNASRFSAGWNGFTLDWYRAMIRRPDILRGLYLSLEIGLISAMISTVLGTALALALHRYRFRGRATLESMIYVPLVTPEIVVGISLLALFAALNISLGVGTILIAHVAFSISFVTVIIGARLGGMDHSLEEAALTLGADEFTTLVRVTIPQLWPGILAGGLLAFTLSFDDYVITSFVTGSGTSTLPVVVYGMVRRTIEPTVNAVSAVVLGVTTVLIYVADWISRRGAK